MDMTTTCVWELFVSLSVSISSSIIIHNGSLCIYTMTHYVYTQWLTMYYTQWLTMYIHKLHILESEVLYTKLVMTMYLHLLKRAHVLMQELCKECIYLPVFGGDTLPTVTIRLINGFLSTLLSFIFLNMANV